MAHVIHTTMLWQVVSGCNAARMFCTHGLQEFAAWLEETEHPVLSCLLQLAVVDGPGNPACSCRTEMLLGVRSS